jgi:ring-1,2-phenylacetyl-CoA epoxidase subunit PaaE
MTFIGIGKKDIFRELFTAPLPDLEAQPTLVTDGKRGTYSVTVVLDGSEHQVEVDANTTILEAVINDGIDPPYACQMGVCTTCRAKLHQGKVEMEEDEGLSDSEISEGYILTCQSHPLTSDCKLEYM